MFLRIFYPCFLLFLLITSIIVSSNVKVEAVSAPDTVSVEHIKAVASVQEVGDVLFVMRYYLYYASTPLETAQQTFFMAIKDQNGNVIASRPLPEEGYGYNVQCIYLSAAQVGEGVDPSSNAIGLVWGPSGEYKGIAWKGTYQAVVMSNPTLFTTPYTDSKTMTDSDWIGALGVSTTLSTGITNVENEIVVESQALEDEDSNIADEYYVILVGSTNKLTSAGAQFWQKRWAGVNSLTGFFTTNASYISVENQTYSGSYLTDLTGTNSLFGSSTTVKDAFTTLGDAIGIPYWQVIAFGVLMIPTFMIVAGSVYGVTGNSKVAAITAAPIMFVISMLIPDAMLMILTGIAAFLVVVIMWRFV